MSTSNVIASGASSAEDETRIAVVAGDGLDGPAADSEASQADLVKFKAEMAQISKDAAYSVNERRFAAEETRFCIWEGQSPDGKKHSDALNGAQPFPFEGASDGRIRLADMIVNERVLLLTTAALLSLPRVMGLELRQEGFAGRMQTLLKWVLNNQLAGEYYREITKLAQFQEADSPAGAVLGVYWWQEYGLKITTMTLPQIVQVLTGSPSQGGFGLDPAELPALEAMLMDPQRDGESAEFLAQLVPEVTKSRARKMVKQLRETQSAEFPQKYLKCNRPKLCAHRLFDDIFFPANTTEFQRARCVFTREWISEVEVRERQVTMGWSEEFVEEVLKHEAQTGFPLYKRDPVQGDFAVARQENKETFKGLYEVITAYYPAVNDDNVPAHYTLTFHHAVDFPAKERELVEYAHGKLPGVYFSREVLTQRLWDARGIPEICATDQNGLKLLYDSFNDNVQLGTVPPIKVPRRRAKQSVVIGPLKIIKEDRQGEISYMESPAYPQGNDKAQDKIMARVNEYFGRICETVLPQLSQLHQSGATRWFLENLREALIMVLQLCQQYLTDEEIQTITGADGLQVARTVEDIQGEFNLQLSFNASALNLDYLKAVFQLIAEYVLPIDTLGTVQRDRLVQWLLSSVDANLAQDVLIPVQAAQQKEVTDEQDNFAKISAGVEPQMVAEGQNFGLRLQVLQNIIQQNPEALQKLTPVSKKIFIARVDYLQNQVQQQKNAQIGRQVGQPALGQKPVVPPGVSGAANGAPAGNGQY
jgi:hypothetical protein